MNILFLCTANINRSKTAEVLFTEMGGNNRYKSAGLSAKYTEFYGSTLCTEELLAWADRVYVFEPMHLERLSLYTGDKYKHKITNIDIEDRYQYMAQSLVFLLKKKLLPLIL